MDAAIDIRPTYNPIGFAAQAAPIRAHVDGVGPYRLTWNQVLRIPVPAGDHTVVVWSTWLAKKWMGLAHALVHLEPGQQVGLSWEMPLTVFSQSTFVCAPVGPAAGLAPGEQAALPPNAGNRAVWPPHPVEPLAEIAAAAPGAAQAYAQPVAGAWHPDPTGRFALRWWDGTRWTEGVSDGTQTLTDPI